MDPILTVQTFVNNNGGHAGAPGQTNMSIGLIKIPAPLPGISPSDAVDPNAGLFGQGGQMSVNLQAPTPQTAAKFPVGSRIRVEFYLESEE